LKIFVTGGAGFIGRYLVKSLLKDHEVTIFDNFSNSSKDNISKLLEHKAVLVKGDITNFKDISSHLSGFDTVIHLAAKISVEESIIHPENTTHVNVDGTINLLRACVSNKIRNIVAASTAAVYGHSIDAKIFLSENSKTDPISPYGASKLVMEQYVKAFSKAYDLNCVTLRLFNVYGLGQSNEYAGVITKFAQNIKEGKPLVINGDGYQTRDFVSIEDVVEGIFNVISKIEGKRGNVYNIASGKFITIKDLASLILTVSRKDFEIQYSDPIEGEIRYSQADISLTKKELDYLPKILLKDGISRFFE